ncbi:phosphopantetheine-binding protein [Streptomyces europaeiscabiei]|uniref:phosphopantetheine-binding protein n=1 Tax=Streptomyces europaeiscabiei TaxID=146819 RepID=UPI0029ADB364|nr:phosphopantetheine-binding protein [Streptomyces europaeiscabiei]MDX3611298.1 phosphopantetheine-binding protein [Streptomyces europaeiscabiei]
MDDEPFFRLIIDMLDELQEAPNTVAALSDPVTGPDINLFDAGLLRSLTVVRLLRALEDHFDVRVPVEQYGMEAFFTLRSIREMMMPLLGAGKQADVK